MSWAQNTDLGFATSIWEPILILVIIIMLIAIPAIVIALSIARKRNRITVYHADTLEVHTANVSPDSDDIIVIITLDQGAFQHLSLIDAPLRLSTPNSRPVTFQPGPGGAPVLDPNEGWIIPISKETRAELRGLPAGNEHELTTTNVAIIVKN